MSFFTVYFLGKGAGDIYIKAECSLVSKTYSIEDCVDVITGETDQTSKFGSSISLRNSGTASLDYQSSGKYYKNTCTKSSSESFLPITSATGLDDFIIEYDGYFASSKLGILGVTVYSDSNNWARSSNTKSTYTESSMTNGTFAENEPSLNFPVETWHHYKIIITNDSIRRIVTNGGTTVQDTTFNVNSGLFSNNTKYGFPVLWGTDWIMYWKNLKIKPL